MSKICHQTFQRNCFQEVGTLQSPKIAQSLRGRLDGFEKLVCQPQGYVLMAFALEVWSTCSDFLVKLGVAVCPSTHYFHLKS
jgi:hypothetical protein